MKSANFEFLRSAAPGLVEIAALAEAYAHSDPSSSAVKARSFVEQAVLTVYSERGLERLPRAELVELLNSAEFSRLVPRGVLTKLHAIRKQGNAGAHGGTIDTRTALWLIEELFDFARWLYLGHYGGSLADIPDYRTPPAGGAEAENKGQLKREKREALEKLAAQEARYQETLQRLEAEREEKDTVAAEAQRLKAELAAKGAEAAAELHFDEATTRSRLIDTMLVEAGWQVGAAGVDTNEVTREQPVGFQPTPTGHGKIDYVLWDDDGQPLAIVEAKRTAIDAADGQNQARYYADGLVAEGKRRPVILYTNGFDIWLWDDAQGWPPRKLFGFYSKDSLQQLIYQRDHAKPLATLAPERLIVDRLYQFEAIKAVTERFTAKRRKALVVQATGTGKTRVAIALADLLLRANWAIREEVDGETHEIYTGDRLTEAQRRHLESGMFAGFDFDATMLRLAAMNMMLHGVADAGITYQDTLGSEYRESDAYDLVLANPPFKGSLDPEDTNANLLRTVKTKKTELLFLALILRMLKPGGRAAVVVPDGVLFGSSTAHRGLREKLIDDNQLEAVVSLPSGVFKPYAGVSTGILFFTKGGRTDEVFFFDVQADGYSLDDKRQEIDDDDLPDALQAWQRYEAGEEDFGDRTQKSFTVPAEEIRANKYDLSIGRYKETPYEEEKYDPPKLIIARMKEMEIDINIQLSQLEEFIS